MPFNIEVFNISGFIIIILGANTLIQIIVNRNFKPFYNKLFIFFCLFYVAHFVGVFYSANVHEAKLVIERKLSLIAFPIILFSAPRLTAKQTRTVLITFVLSCLLVCVACLLMAATMYASTPDVNFLSYHALSNNVGMHAAYLSLYLCFCIGVLLYVYYSEAKAFSAVKKMLYTLALTVLFVMVMMLSSRLQILMLIVGISIYLVYRLGLNKNIYKLISGTVLMVILLFGLILAFPKNRERFKEAISYNQEYSLSKKWGEKQMRHLIWKSSMELIGEKPLIGFGTGDAQDKLQEVYKRNEYISLTYFKKTRFNAHNQFLETTIALGIIGLSILLLGIGLAIKNALRNKNYLYIIFVSAFFISCLTESMLERQNGVIFFAFFNTFLLLNYTRKNE